jgi:hypothetical protein
MRLNTCPVPRGAIFLSSTLDCVPAVTSKYFRYYRGKLPVAPVFIGVTFAFTLHMRCIHYSSKSLYSNASGILVTELPAAS